MDKFICRTEHFTVKAAGKPHVPREDGGHVLIEANDPECHDRIQLSGEQAMECAWLCQICGQAIWDVLPTRGIDLYRLNYQDNGNWSFVRGEPPLLHIHIYGRAVGERHQEFGQALVLPYPTTGFYEGFTPLSDEDAAALASRIEDLAQQERFQWERGFALTTDNGR